MKPIIDISEHEGLIDFKKLAPLVAGVVIRCGYGNQKDANFEVNYVGAKTESIPVATYHFPIDQRPVNEMLDNVMKWLDGKYFEHGFGVDVEKPPVSTGHTLSKETVDYYIPSAVKRMGAKPMIYTNKYAWQEIMGASNDYVDYLNWLAEYYYIAKDIPISPALPAGWKVWTMWQYTDRGKIDGINAAVDLNYYNTALMDKIAPLAINVPELKAPIGKLITTNTTEPLMVRSEPKIASNNIVGTLPPASTREYYEIQNNWYRIGVSSQWIMGTWVKVLEKYPTNPTPPPVEPPVVTPPSGYLFEAEVVTTYDYLTVRDGPSTSYKEVGQLKNGEVVKVLESTKDRWYRIGINKWIFGERTRSKTLPLTTLAYPMEKEFRISQLFGVNSGTYATSAGHNGIDYACYGGTRLIAAADGFVETREDTTTYGYGRHVRIRVQGGVLIYGHMKEIYPQLGAKVKKGDVIGLSDGAVGMPYAGFSTGNHLHFEYRIDSEPYPLKAGNKKYWAINTLPITEAPATILKTSLFRKNWGIFEFLRNLWRKIKK